MKIESNQNAVLLKIAKALNEANIVWAVGASILLDYHNLSEEAPHDIDLIVHVKDINKCVAVLNELGEKQRYERSEAYSTPYFFEYLIEEVEVDVMSLLTINTLNGTFRYHFDETYVVDTWLQDDISIPLTSLEDWYILYALMGNRKDKVLRIADSLHTREKVQINLVKELKQQGVMPEELMRGISQLQHSEIEFIRPALANESGILSELAANSEAHWGYDDIFMNQFRTFYAVDQDFILENPTFVYIRDNQIIGFYSLNLKGRFCELEFMYVKPEFIGKGVGAILWHHMIKQCKKNEIEMITLVTSPQAKGFYEKMGAKHSGDVPSLLDETKIIPKLYYKLDWLGKIEIEETRYE